MAYITAWDIYLIRKKGVIRKYPKRDMFLILNKQQKYLYSTGYKNEGWT